MVIVLPAGGREFDSRRFHLLFSPFQTWCLTTTTTKITTTTEYPSFIVWSGCHFALFLFIRTAIHTCIFFSLPNFFLPFSLGFSKETPLERADFAPWRLMFCDRFTGRNIINSFLPPNFVSSFGPMMLSEDSLRASRLRRVAWESALSNLVSLGFSRLAHLSFLIFTHTNYILLLTKNVAILEPPYSWSVRFFCCSEASSDGF